ncbi:MAG: GumC family protein [Syntrophobacteraceae bacterium]
MQNDSNNGSNRTDILAAAAAPFPSNAGLWYQEEYEEGMNLRDYLYVLRKRKWWVLGILAGAIVLTLLYIHFKTPVWEGRVTLQITQDRSSAALGSGGSGLDPLGSMMGSSEMDRFYTTQYAILKSQAIAYGLMDALKLQDSPAYKAFVKAHPKLSIAAVRQIYAKQLLGKLTVSPMRNSFLVDILFQSTDKAFAQKVPAVIGSVYLNFCMKTRQKSFAMLRDWLDKQLVKTGGNLETSEKQTIAAGQKGEAMGVGMSDKSLGANVVIQKYVQISRLLTTAQAKLATKKALYEQIEEKGTDAPVIINNPLIAGLRGQLIAAESQTTGSGQVYGPNFPAQKINVATVNTIQKKLNAAVRQQVMAVRSDYQAALKAQRLLKVEFEDARAKLGTMENGLVGFHMLQRDMETNQALYQGLLGRMKDAAVESTMVPSNIAVINPSDVPLAPYKPQPVKDLALAVILGTMFGIGTAFLLEYLDSSIKTTEEMEKVSRIPSLGIIPLAENGERPKTALETISYFEPKSQISEAVSHIRSAIMLSASSGPPQTIVVTSCNPSEGKSTCSCNIAIALSRGQRKTVIIDCDLRKPRLHRVFNVSNRKGLTNLLTGSASLEEIMKKTQVPDLYFIPAGPTPPSPGELIGSDAFKDMIAALRGQFQQIVLDSPPVIGFADARLLAAVADGAVLLFKHLCTTREAAKLAVQMLWQNNSQILGSVLTMAKKNQLGYGAYYGYYKYYNKNYESYRDADKKTIEN